MRCFIFCFRAFFFFHRQCALVKLAIGEIIFQHKIKRINGPLPEWAVVSLIADSRGPNEGAKHPAVSSGIFPNLTDTHASPSAGTRQCQPSWNPRTARLKGLQCPESLFLPTMLNVACPLWGHHVPFGITLLLRNAPRGYSASKRISILNWICAPR